VDDLGNPDDIEMAELCGCGHPLGQHEYGAGDWHQRCDHEHCGCTSFHIPPACGLHRGQPSCFYQHPAIDPDG
jgi:hypothetical protein